MIQRSRPQDMTAYLAFRAPESDRERLVRLAERLDRPTSWVIREAVRQYVESAGQDQREAVKNG